MTKCILAYLEPILQVRKKNALLLSIFYQFSALLWCIFYIFAEENKQDEGTDLHTPVYNNRGNSLIRG